MRAHRAHVAWWAFLAHRISGVALALFLPLHFLVLGSALAGAESLDGVLAWTEAPLVVVGGWIVVVLLAVHLAGGLRVLVLEFLPWRDWQKTLATLAALFAFIAGLVFALAR